MPRSFGLQSGVAVVADDFIGLPDMLGAIQLFDAALFIFEDEDVAVAVGTLPHTLRQPLLDDFESHSLILFSMIETILPRSSLKMRISILESKASSLDNVYGKLTIS